MVIRPPLRPKLMDYVRFSDLLRSTTLATLVLMLSFTGFLALEEKMPEREQLEDREMPLYATSPGHPVFGEYVGAHWCGPCMNSASPSLDNLKSSNPEDFTFVSFFESSSGGWPADSPINRRSHVMASSSGYPTFSFADSQSGTCYKVGAAGSNYYDADYSAGGCMGSNSGDYVLSLSVVLDSATNQVTVNVESTYVGSSSSVVVYLYAAITEKIGADAYDNGVRPHHNFRDWLLNSNQNGFEQLTLTPNNPVQTSWTVSLNKVRAAGGNTQFENFWPVIALMDGPHNSYNSILSAADLGMTPLVDLAINSLSANNQNGNSGFVPGDVLDLTVEVTNEGVEHYTDGGEISVYELVGMNENYVGGASIQSIQSGSSQSLTVQFDTSHIDTYASGTTTFRAKLSGLSGDRVSSNNYADENAPHDMPPVANQPSAVASVTIDRGDSIQFESTALSNDLVDDMATMIPIMHYALSGTDSWDDQWIVSSDLVGSGGNARYLHTINAPLSADIGDYDLRIRWADAGGQLGSWLISEDAFTLRNGLPTVLNGDSPFYAGMPTVKVETQERVSVIGLVHDAETPISLLNIDSNSPEFIEWDSSSMEIVVNFDEVVRDSQGNPIPQGLFVTIDDGDDTNSGMMMFNVIENGAPRWAPIPTQSFDEGGSASISLTGYLSDTDDNGNQIPTSGLTLEVISNSEDSLVEASISGHSLTVSSLDDDSNGLVEIGVRASDGSKTSDTVIVFHVLNVNDAPRLNMDGIDEFTVEMGERITLELLGRMADIDDPVEEIWATATTFVPGAAQFNPITGILTMEWSEPGIETVTITLEDRHGDANAYMITVTVVDNLPLLWDDDLVATFDTTEYGSNPTVIIENVGPYQLSDLRVTWTVCNSITGICHSSGISHNLGPFIVNPSSGTGLGIGDYVTLSVFGEDQDGFDRLTEIQYKIFASEPVEPTDSETEENQPSESTIEISKWLSTGLLLIGVLLSTALVLALVIVLRRQNLDSESAIDYTNWQEVDETYGLEPEPTTQLNPPPPVQAPSPSMQIPPPPPQIPPLPPEGLPPGWTMEQWHYYGEEYLRRRQ